LSILNTRDLFHFEALFNKYYAGLCYYAYKFVQNKEVAKDLVQDVFVMSWDKRNDFTTELNIKNYLYISLRNSCLNYLRHSVVEKKFIELSDINAHENEKGLTNLIKAELVMSIREAIDKLPEGCRMVLKLAYFEGLKNDEIATELGISINTVKTQRQRAMKLMRLSLTSSTYSILGVILPILD
jgi:RNA polymerase sigma-70 factor (ECF subfamily)